MFEKFKRNYDEAIEHIKSCINTPIEDDEYEFGVLAHWMLTTDINPYGYLPANLAGAVESAEQFSSLLHYLYKVAYVDVFTARAQVEWVTPPEISKTPPTNYN